MQLSAQGCTESSYGTHEVYGVLRRERVVPCLTSEQVQSVFLFLFQEMRDLVPTALLGLLCDLLLLAIPLPLPLSLLHLLVVRMPQNEFQHSLRIQIGSDRTQLRPVIRLQDIISDTCLSVCLSPR